MNTRDLEAIVERERTRWRAEDTGRRQDASRTIPHLTLHGAELKSCARCAHLLPLSAFGNSQATEDGLRPACKQCEAC